MFLRGSPESSRFLEHERAGTVSPIDAVTTLRSIREDNGYMSGVTLVILSVESRTEEVLQPQGPCFVRERNLCARRAHE